MTFVVLAIAAILGLSANLPTAASEPTPAEQTAGVTRAVSPRTCHTFTRTAYAYTRPHYPTNRKAELVLTVRACVEQDEYDLDFIASHSCTASSRSYRPRVSALGGLYSSMTEDFDDIYQRGLRCMVDSDRYSLFAQVGADWRQTRTNRPPRFACPNIYAFFYAGDTDLGIDEVSHDDFETRGNYNGDYSWRCPVWR